MLSPGRTADGARNVSLWVYADDCDAAIAKLRAVGVTITEEPADQPWVNGSPASWIPTGTT